MGFQWVQDGSSHHLRAGQRYHFASVEKSVFAALCEVLGGRSATISVSCRNFAAIFSTAARV